LALGALAGLTYLSWILGYFVNPSVTTGGLASDLEVPGQPFAWLFVGFDIASGTLMVVVSILLWRSSARRLLVVSILGYALFGLASIISAAMPLSCGSGRAALLACGTSPNSYGFHDAISVVGYFAFFVSVISAVVLSWLAPVRWRLRLAAVAVGLLWSISGVTFLVLALAGSSEVGCQHVLLAATSAAIALFPFVATSQRQPRRATFVTGESLDSTHPAKIQV
jgi:Protein of unknown function (DUF998)